MPAEDERRERGERRTEARLDVIEMQVEQIAPAAVHLAEVSVQYATIQRQQADLRVDVKETNAELRADLNAWIERLDNRLDPLHARLRRAEYALIALGLALASPKFGGPNVAHSVGVIIQSWFG